MAADKIMPGGRTSRIRDPQRLQAIAQALQGVVEAIEPAAGASNFADRSAENRAPNTSIQPTSESCSAPRTGNLATDVITVRGALSVATPEFRELFAMQGSGSWRALEDTARLVAVSHGIQRRTWDRMCQDWQPQVAALSVLLIDRNAHLPVQHRWRARSFGGCLGGLAKDASKLIPMFRAAQSSVEDERVGRELEPEPHRMDERQRIDAVARGILANVQIVEVTHD